MLKATEETIVFNAIICIIWGILIAMAHPPPLATPMVLKKLMQLKCITNGGRLLVIFRKEIAFLMPFRSHFTPF